MELKKFEDLNISSEVKRAIRDLGFENATPIQSQSIDLILDGKDIFGQSQTGTGKTGAFAIPCIEKIDGSNKNLQAIVLCPTRELAMQVSEEFRKFLKYKKDVKVLPVYGGQQIDRQITALRKGVQIVVGTPGRVMDHMRRKTIKFSDLKMVILDEADEMLNMGFREDIESILEKTNQDRQTILFSATLPKAILKIINTFQNDPEHIKIQKKEITVTNIEQKYMVVPERSKFEALCRVIDVQNPNLAIVFCNTKRRVDDVVEKLQKRGYFAAGLHGDLKQLQRDVVMKKFRTRTLRVLVATDVAARGIDVDDVELVLNFDLPQEAEYYVHRIGRTGRAGKKGFSVSLVTSREIRRLKEIISYTKSVINEDKPPSITDIEKAKSEQYFASIKKVMEKDNLEKYKQLIYNYVGEGYELIDIASAILKLQLHNDAIEDVDFNERRRGRDNNRGSNNNGGGRRGNNGGKTSGKGSGNLDGKSSTRLFFNVGKKDRISPKDLVGAIANESGISSNNIGSIDIFNEFSFVDVSKNFADTVLSKVNGKKLRGKSISVEKAKKNKR